VSGDGQQGETLVEAQAPGLGRDGELLLLGPGKLDGREPPAPELGVLLDQVLASGSAAVLGRNGGQHLLGMVGDARTTTADRLGRGGDRVVGASPARGGIGDPTERLSGNGRDSRRKSLI
jgi:hypothetical protein